MRIRFFTRTQAICLVISLLLGVFCLGLGLGMLGAGLFTPTEQALPAFAFLDEDASVAEQTGIQQTPAPVASALPSEKVMEINLFSFDVSSTETLPPPVATPSSTMIPATAPGEFSLEVIRKAGDTENAKKKRILIYHTHTYEAYEPTALNPYEQTERWRTKDNEHNVVRVGEELVRLLTAAGYTVVHDTTAYEPPILSTSYTRSLAMLDGTISRNEKYDLYIDLHRDAYTSSMANQNTVKVGDQSLAKLFFLIGKGVGQTGIGYEKKPEWEKNLELAQSLTDCLNEQVSGLCRPVRVKSGRFNQHIAPCCILVEVGNNKNTLEEALASVPYLADAIRSVLSEN